MIMVYRLFIHSSTLAWKIPWTEEPGRLLSMGSQRVRHDWVTSLPFFLWLFIQSPSLLVCSNFLFLHDSFLVDYMFLSIYQFLLDFPICWRIAVHSNHLMILGIFVISVVTSLIYHFIYVLSFFCCC